MSILIEDMKMPENCYECPCCRHDSLDGIQTEQCNITLDVFDVNDQERWKGRPAGCPLVEEEKADCATCKHGYFGSAECNRCSHGYPDNYERDERYG